MAEVEWRRMRAEELNALAKRDPIAIVPIGALEQHGPHLPVEVDALLGEEVALRTARLLDQQGIAVTVLPMLWAGVSEHHMSLGGTITLSQAAMTAVVGDICRSLARQGFRRIVLFNAHGGNEAPLRAIARELSPDLGAALVQLTYWLAAAEVVKPLLKSQSNVGHACEAETSLMMALRPELVAHDRIVSGLDASDSEESAASAGLYRWRSMAASTGSGVLGRPEAATRETGEALLEALPRRLAERLAEPVLWSMAA
jgi:creatinine amidohydrolase